MKFLIPSALVGMALAVPMPNPEGTMQGDYIYEDYEVIDNDPITHHNTQQVSEPANDGFGRNLGEDVDAGVTSEIIFEPAPSNGQEFNPMLAFLMMEDNAQLKDMLPMLMMSGNTGALGGGNNLNPMLIMAMLEQQNGNNQNAFGDLLPFMLMTTNNDGMNMNQMNPLMMMQLMGRGSNSDDLLEKMMMMGVFNNQNNANNGGMNPFLMMELLE